MRNKKRNRVLFLLILLLGIGIGFAALATTLKINGTAIINRSTWNIYWDNVANETGVTPETHPQITPDENNVPKTLLTWSVTLNEPGDFYEFEVDAVNAGTLDAEIIGIDSKVGESSIISTVDGELVEANPSPVPSYIKYSVKYADGTAVGLGDKLPKAPDLTSTPPVYTRKTYKIRVEYDRDAVTNAQVNGMEDDVTLTFTYHVTYGQAAPEVAPESPWTLPQGKDKDTLETGDEVCMNLENQESQCFEVLKYDGDDVVMFAKYNLNVGPHAYNSETFIQDSNVLGYRATAQTYGYVPFSARNYWYDYGMISDYGNEEKHNNIYEPTRNSQPVDSSFSDLPIEPETYSVAYYVEQYKTILETGGATIKEARLITFDELIDPSIGCNDSTSKCPTNSFVSRTSYWVASCYYDSYVYGVDYVSSNGTVNFYNYSYTLNSELGVRPVIVVEKSNL